VKYCKRHGDAEFETSAAQFVSVVALYKRYLRSCVLSGFVGADSEEWWCVRNAYGAATYEQTRHL
jgi:hypothetical protein